MAYAKNAMNTVRRFKVNNTLRAKMTISLATELAKTGEWVSFLPIESACDADTFTIQKGEDDE